ncbi:MAG: flagellar basal body P-ring formation protein FlgA [Hyphomicrobiales bacterium]|nr:flagellar basal body P-ring formation protein FlgA [Hyphomicrobiales bacterium]
MRSLLAGLIIMLSFPCVGAAEDLAPAPVVTIYPGDIITPAMIGAGPPVSEAPGAIASRDELIGRVARRTLFAGQPVPPGAVDDPKALANGAGVQLIFQQGGITITTRGQMLQSARVGDAVRVRNSETGLVATGVVQTNGSVRVSE